MGDGAASDRTAAFDRASCCACKGKRCISVKLQCSFFLCWLKLFACLRGNEPTERIRGKLQPTDAMSSRSSAGSPDWHLNLPPPPHALITPSHGCYAPRYHPDSKKSMCFVEAKNHFGSYMPHYLNSCEGRFWKHLHWCCWMHSSWFGKERVRAAYGGWALADTNYRPKISWYYLDRQSQPVFSSWLNRNSANLMECDNPSICEGIWGGERETHTIVQDAGFECVSHLMSTVRTDPAALTSAGQSWRRACGFGCEIRTPRNIEMTKAFRAWWNFSYFPIKVRLLNNNTKKKKPFEVAPCREFGARRL